MDVYQDYDLSESRRAIIQKKIFLEEKLKEREKALQDSEEELATYKKQNKVFALDNETQQLVEQVASFESLHAQALSEFEANDQELVHLKGQLDKSRKSMLEEIPNQTNTIIDGLYQGLTEKVKEKTKLEAQMLEAGYDITNNAQLKAKQVQIEGIRKQISLETRKLLDKEISHERKTNASHDR